MVSAGTTVFSWRYRIIFPAVPVVLNFSSLSTNPGSEPANAVDTETTTCRAYATSLYESVTLRQTAAKCGDGGRKSGCA
jgi:hypothetical protein